MAEMDWEAEVLDAFKAGDRELDRVTAVSALIENGMYRDKDEKRRQGLSGRKFHLVFCVWYFGSEKRFRPLQQLDSVWGFLRWGLDIGLCV